MKKIIFSALLVSTLAVTASPNSAKANGAPGSIQAIQLSPGRGGAQLAVRYSGEARFRVFQIDAQRKVVVEGDNLLIPSNLTKTIESASTNGPVVQVTPYQGNAGGRNITKIVLQLRQDVTTSHTDQPGTFVLSLQPKTPLAAGPEANGSAGKVKVKAIANKGWSEADELKVRSGSASKSAEVAEKLVEVLNAPTGDKKYFGSKVSFESSNASVHDVFRLVGEASGLNILSDKEVSTKEASYSLKDVPWDQLLDLVIQSQQLKASVNGNVVSITTLAQYTKLQDERLKELVATDANEPVLMAVIPLSFAKAADVKKSIEELLIAPASTGSPNANNSGQGSGGQGGTTPGSGTSGGAQGGGQGSGSQGGSAQGATVPSLAQAFKRGKVQEDTRTNSLLVTNTKTAIERIKRLVKELDTAQPQVLIDSRFVSAAEGFGRSLGVQWGSGAASSSGRTGMGITYGGTPTAVGDSAPTTGSVARGFVPSVTGETAPSTMAGLFKIGAGNFALLQARLDLAESRNTSRTVASPRVMVSNNEKATITDSQTRNTIIAGGNGVPGSRESDTAAISLDVTPTVAADGSVFMDITSNNGAFGDAGASTNKSIATKVSVESGSTLVLGGIFSLNESLAENGIPVLKDLPFIGDLFKQTSRSKNKSEMLVFVTPQVVDPETPLGLTGDRSQL